MAGNVLEDWPASTVTVDGTLRSPPPLVMPTTAPPAGAGCESVTVHVAEAGVASDDGAQLRPESDSADARETDAVTVVPPAVADTVAEEALVTIPACAVKLADIAPGATAVEAGTLRSVEFEARVTVSPPAGAAFVSVTVQVEVPPALSGDGAHDTLEGSAGARRFNVTFCVSPL
ncbi:MAG: hypothetical protein IPM24_22085 [Bryobacterales bacterium]|nr:hypothetical protein [Bryobacterales bacterium]